MGRNREPFRRPFRKPASDRFVNQRYRHRTPIAEDGVEQLWVYSPHSVMFQALSGEFDPEYLQRTPTWSEWFVSSKSPLGVMHQAQKAKSDRSYTRQWWAKEHLDYGPTASTTYLSMAGRHRHGRCLLHQHLATSQAERALEYFSDKTPSTLTALIAEHASMTKTTAKERKASAMIECVDRYLADNLKPSTLLSLPLELREIIYRHILVATTPIDFAPCWSPSAQPGYESFNHLRVFGRYIGSCPQDQDWFQSSRLEMEIRPALKLLRTCRQIRHEASQIYYGQPFRFSSSAGWNVLYIWLKQIGPRNRQFLKDITVCHPAMADDYDAERLVSWSRGVRQ